MSPSNAAKPRTKTVAALGGDALGHRGGSETARLGDDDGGGRAPRLLERGVQQELWHLRRLAAAGLAADNHHRMRAHGLRAGHSGDGNVDAHGRGRG